MKRLFAIVLAAVLVLTAFSVCALADEALSADVYVTVSDKGTLAAAAEKITVTDVDGDGALTINDTIYAAHERFYEGGAAAGYETSVTQWGLGITKMWGNTDGNFGYYVNNASAWSLADPVKADDYVAAFNYSDPGLSDRYLFFDKSVEDVEAGEVALTLYMSYYDADNGYALVTEPVEGAVITVDGASSGVKTDADGKAAINLDVNGKHVVSAAADGIVIVPPVYVATVSGGKDPETVPATAPQSSTTAATQPQTQSATQKATSDSSSNTTGGTNTNAVQTGPSGYVYIIIALAAVALGAALFAKKKNED